MRSTSDPSDRRESMNQPPTVICDYRERRSGIPDRLEKLGVHMRYSQIAVGDYVLPGQIVVERKTAQDFVSSLFQGRLLQQAARLAATATKPTIIVEGSLWTTAEELKNPNALYGALATIVYEYGCRVFMTKTSEETAIILAFVARHAAHSKMPLDTYSGKRVNQSSAATLWERQLVMIKALPGIGPKYGRRLLKGFGNLRQVFNATPEELMEIARMPPATAIKVFEFINGLYPSTSRLVAGKRPVGATEFADPLQSVKEKRSRLR